MTSIITDNELSLKKIIAEIAYEFIDYKKIDKLITEVKNLGNEVSPDAMIYHKYINLHYDEMILYESLDIISKIMYAIDILLEIFNSTNKTEWFTENNYTIQSIVSKLTKNHMMKDILFVDEAIKVILAQYDNDTIDSPTFTEISVSNFANSLNKTVDKIRDIIIDLDNTYLDAYNTRIKFIDNI